MIKKSKGDAYHAYMEQLGELTSAGLMLTDTHAHIHFDPLAQDIDGVVKRAAAHAVGRIVTVGIDLEDSRNAVAVAEAHDPVYAVVGVHPHDAENFSVTQLSAFEELAGHPKVLAIGEVGLDFYRNHSPHNVQEDVFAMFLDLAGGLKKPVVIHNREATDRTIAVMDSVVEKRLGAGVIHCFGGDRKLMKWALDAGFFISYAGPVTYGSADDLRDTLAYVPVDRLLIETDCPYLAPMPHRGKTNEPAFAAFTAETVAAHKKIGLAELATQLEHNFSTLFSGR